MLRADPTEFYIPSMPAPQSVLKRAALRIASVVQAWVNRRRLMPLLELDDRMLQDIGVTRFDVSAALAAPAGQDPSQRLAALSNERRGARRLRHAPEGPIPARYY